jgi:hypothetical protein
MNAILSTIQDPVTHLAHQQDEEGRSTLGWRSDRVRWVSAASGGITLPRGRTVPISYLTALARCTTNPAFRPGC